MCTRFIPARELVFDGFIQVCDGAIDIPLLFLVVCMTDVVGLFWRSRHDLGRRLNDDPWLSILSFDLAGHGNRDVLELMDIQFGAGRVIVYDNPKGRIR